MIEQLLIDSIFLKIGEKLVEYGWEAVTENNSEFTLENLKINFKLLSAKAYDVEKEISIAEQSGKKKSKKQVEEWLEEVKKVESELRALENAVQTEGLIKQFFGGDQLIKLNKRVCELVEQSRHFGELVLDDDSARGEALLAPKLVGEAFDKNLEKILKFLVIDQVSSIGIYGMGGVGKSTLAKHINNQLLERTQECVLWVTISQERSITMLQEKIARVVHLDLSDEDDEEKRAARLNRALSQKKNFVLILDDVWRYINLEKVGVPDFVEGCKLIITTRSLEVCRQMGCRELIAVKPLHVDEGWELFREKLGQETILASQVQEIAKSMAKVCSGLPLGIITIAGSMRGETDIRVWRNALTELKQCVMVHDEMEDQVLKVLKYSFDRLDQNHRWQEKRNGHTSLQLCFLYCALYPEDCNILRDELVRRLISEDLVDKRKSIIAQLDEGHSILNRLVNVSLLETVLDFEDRDCVKMHDLVRAMALNITRDKTMVVAGQYSLEKIPDEEEWTPDLEKISLMRNRIKKIPDGISPNCPKLSTLLLKWNPLELIAESFFSRMCGLCILDLCGTQIKELPNSIADLESLKTLLLGACLKLKYVPYLGKLRALRELDISYTAIRKVPSGMEELVNLKYLSMYGADHLQMLPASLFLNLTCLQHLGLPLQLEAPLEEIEKLKQLEEFEGRLKDMRDFSHFVESQKSKKHNVSYCIMVGKFNTYLEVSEVYERKNKLIVHCCDLKNREGRDHGIMLVDDIQYLQLDNCLLDNLSNWPRSLEKLEIIGCEGIECILTNEQLMAPQELESRFHALQEIELEFLDDFMGVIHNKQEIGIGGAVVVASPPPPLEPPPVFSSLRRLSISKCNKMKKAGLPIFVLQNLEEISIEWCEEIEELVEVAEDDGRRGEGEAPLVTLPKLKKLHLERLPQLKSICKLTMICNSLEEMILRKCPTLKKVPLYFPASTAAPPYSHSAPPALREIELFEEEKEWWNSLEWDHPSHTHLLQPLLRFDDRYC